MSNDDTTTETTTTTAAPEAGTDKLDAAGAAALARAHGLSLADSTALRGLTAAEAGKVVAASAGNDPMSLASRIAR